MSEVQKQDNRETGLIDVELLQKFQTQFCKANGIYLVCLGTEEGVITNLYGSKEARAFLRRYLNEGTYLSLLRKLKGNAVEHMVEEETDYPYVRLGGVSTHVEDKTQIIWCAVAFLQEYINDEVELPDYIMTVHKEDYYRSLEFLEYLSKMLMAVKMDELIAQEAMLIGRAAKESVEKQLHRSETMTQVVTMLESDNGFGKIVDDILKLVCNCLDISSGCLLRDNADEQVVDMICEYAKEREWYRIADFQAKPKSEIPFFTGKPYMISSDSIYPEPFAKFFEENGITAGIFQPIEVSGKNIMYLCFYEIGKERIWDVNDIKFLNDVKRIVQSILTKRIAKNSLASSFSSLEAILENVGCGIYVLDVEQKKLLYTNQKFNELFANSISSGKINQILYQDNEVKQAEVFREVYSAEEDRWLDVNKCRINWVDGRNVVLCTIYDITDKKLYQKKIESQANNDFLTGLYNRKRCEEDLDRYIRIAELNGVDGALLYIDLDDFKHINDGLGHQYGDVLLKAIGHSLQRIEGIENNCYRMGGDEFVVIVKDINAYSLEKICDSILDIFSNPWMLKGEDYYCTMSMGVVKFPSDGNSVEDLIRKSDMALFAAKKQGKNRVEYYNDTDSEVSHRRLDLEKNMRKATLDSCKEFEVYYQPIVDVSKEGDPCCGAEALVRWNSSEMGFVTPTDFIPLAEYLGLINPIGDYVLHQAAKRCRYWNEMGHPDYKVNVNLSVVQLLQNDIVKKVKGVLEETRITPRNLTLEVTESLAINDMERMKKILGQLKELGVKVALDDFGTGYSSLNHIREMPIDVIKIDRCFVEHIGEDDFSDAFVKMVSELATTLDVDICTEGVETTEQYEAIKALGIRMIQGYYFNKPMKLEEFERKYL
ncbi:MAG: EAL domain-containing protein [Agathobacter sp.]